MTNGEKFLKVFGFIPKELENIESFKRWLADKYNPYKRGTKTSEK